MYRPFEVLYLISEPFLPCLHRKVRSDLRGIVQACSQARRSPVQLLDVGGRKSHYTIGLKANVTLLDLPRQSEIQHELNLGITDKMLAELKKRRSNVSEIILKDFNANDFLDSMFDIITAIEVIEHVPDDNTFIREAFRLLKPGGVLYLTTPNGIAKKNTNPDHVRHYTRRELEALLGELFDEVVVEYRMKISRWRKWGLRGLLPFKMNRSAIIIKSMLGNLINNFEKVHFPREAAHLIALGVKRV